MKTYESPIAQDLMAWLMGAAERNGMQKVPSKFQTPRVAGDREIGPASDALKKLFCCKAGLDDEMSAVEKKVLATDSHSTISAFREDMADFGVPLRGVLDTMIGLQLRKEGQMEELGPEYVAVALAEGGIMVAHTAESYLLLQKTVSQRGGRGVLRET